MQEFKIDKKIENEVETIILLGKQIKELKDKYPVCLNILRKQFKFSDSYYDNSHSVPDDIENVKLSIYAEILRQNNKNEEIKKQKIQKKLNNK